MNKKELTDLLKAAYAVSQNVAKKKAELEKDERLTPEGKSEALSLFVASQGADTIRKNVLDGIEEAQASLEKKWADELNARLEDTEYQSILNTTLKAVEAGAISSPRDLDALAVKYQGDAVALKLLDAAASAQGIGVSGFRKDDMRERYYNNLSSIANNVKEYVSSSKLQNDPSMTVIAVSGNLDFLDNSEIDF